MNSLRRLSILAGLLSVMSWANAVEDLNPASGPVIWDEHKVYTVTDKSVILHTHPASIWDEHSSCRKGNRDFDRVLDSFYARLPNGDARRLRRFLFVGDNPLNDDQYFLKTSDVTTVVNSAGGAHNIRFPNLERVIFSGGNFGACLCQTVRDVVKGTAAEKKDYSVKPLEMTFVTDAIYCNGAQRPPGMPQEIRKSTVDNFSVVVKYATDAELISEVTKLMFNEKDNRICGGDRNNIPPDHPRMSDYTVILIKDGREVGKISKGKQLIRAEFVTTEEYAASLEKQNPGLARAQ